MTVTVPLRLSDEIIRIVDEIIAERNGVPSRNAVLRELILEGGRAMKGKRRG